MAQLVDKAKDFVGEKVENMKKPEASVTDVDLIDISRDYITFNVKVSVSNPYSTSIPICEISYTLKSAGRAIASGTIQDPGTLKADATTMLDVEVKVPYNVLLSLAIDIAADCGIEYELDMGVSIDLPLIRNFTIPVSSKGEMKLPSFSDMFTE